MFPFALVSPQEDGFKSSKRGTFLKNLPTFSDAPASNLASCVSSSPLVFTPMSLAFEIKLDNVPSDIIKNIDNDLLKFVKHCT